MKVTKIIEVSEFLIRGVPHKIPWDSAIHHIGCQNYEKTKARLSLVDSWVDIDLASPNFGSNNLIYKFKISEIEE